MWDIVLVLRIIVVGCCLAIHCHIHYHLHSFHFVLLKFKNLVAKQHTMNSYAFKFVGYLINHWLPTQLKLHTLTLWHGISNMQYYRQAITFVMISCLFTEAVYWSRVVISSLWGAWECYVQVEVCILHLHSICYSWKGNHDFSYIIMITCMAQCISNELADH